MTVLTVSQINSYVKQVLDGDKNLKGVFISGEISNFKGQYSSGHLYFSLKDSGSAISAVMFAPNASRLRFKPENGMKVIVGGRISIYETTGQYQLYVESMQPDGKGALAVAYEQLKKKLTARGVFDESRKLPLPMFPEKIGVITSASGAVIQDIKNVVSRRCPLTEIILYPSSVQGDNAPSELIEGIKYFNEARNVDVIIIGRGGGSFEDLNCFNDEKLVLAIYDSEIPVISAVGHETDFTLCDFVSDKRAPTPSAAAELAVPSIDDLTVSVNGTFAMIYKIANEKLSYAYRDIDRLKDRITSKSPEKQLENEILSVRLIYERINSTVEKRLTLEKSGIDSLANSINALSPIRLLQKGYSITKKENGVISSVAELGKGDTVEVRLSDGSAECTVREINKLGDQQA